MPKAFVPPILVKELAVLALRMRGRSIASLAELPDSPDPRVRMAVKLMAAFAKAAYQLRPELCVTVATKTVDLCLREGNAEDAAIGYMVYGAIFQGGVLGRHRAGYEYGKLSRAIVERHRNERQRAEVTFVVAYFATSWVRPAIEAEALYAEAFAAGLEVRDRFHVGCAAAATIMSLWMRGVSFAEIEREAERLLATIAPMRLHEPIGTIEAVCRAIALLRDGAVGSDVLATIVPDEGALDRYGSPHFAHFQLLVAALAAYRRGDDACAARALERAGRFAGSSRGTLHSAEHVFLQGLLLARAAPPGRAARFSTRVRLAWIARQLSRWAKDCPANFAAKSALLDAELAWIEGRLERGADLFTQAARRAEERGDGSVLAIARRRGSELAAASLSQRR